MMESIRKTIRLSVILLTGATMAIAGSLTQPCKKNAPKDTAPFAKDGRVEAFCAAGLGRSDAGLKGGDAATWHQSGSMFTAKYSALLSNPGNAQADKPVAEFDGKPVPAASYGTIAGN